MDTNTGLPGERIRSENARLILSIILLGILPLTSYPFVLLAMDLHPLFVPPWLSWWATGIRSSCIMYRDDTTRGWGVLYNERHFQDGCSCCGWHWRDEKEKERETFSKLWQSSAPGKDDERDIAETMIWHADEAHCSGLFILVPGCDLPGCRIVYLSLAFPFPFQRICWCRHLNTHQGTAIDGWMDGMCRMRNPRWSQCGCGGSACVLCCCLVTGRDTRNRNKSAYGGLV